MRLNRSVKYSSSISQKYSFPRADVNYEEEKKCQHFYGCIQESNRSKSHVKYSFKSCCEKKKKKKKPLRFRTKVILKNLKGSFQHTSVQKPNLGNLRKTYSWCDPASELVYSLDFSSIREYGIIVEDSMMK